MTVHPGEYVSGSLLVQVVAVDQPVVTTFTGTGTCEACGRPEADHDVRQSEPGRPAYCLVQPSTVAILHAFTLPGEPCRVACEPRMAADIVADMAAHAGQPTYLVVERWQLI